MCYPSPLICLDSLLKLPEADMSRLSVAVTYTSAHPLKVQSKVV